ncbi:hypothetical protein [Candidatus Gromoviella agglomerans]|uniref:hypothetical protein n=1 Tax=Candidatus Gromoviella agglomerans TaxID=2806609 RepID=UPI001E5B9C10|nr:hypothetical protein [Candidatus Gromoviella agglomerans]UFX98141.1 hypothetical protein Gromo_00020 [Candidatus Gromoviella agglomerans]
MIKKANKYEFIENFKSKACILLKFLCYMLSLSIYENSYGSKRLELEDVYDVSTSSIQLARDYISTGIRVNRQFIQKIQIHNQIVKQQIQQKTSDSSEYIHFCTSLRQCTQKKCDIHGRAIFIYNDLARNSTPTEKMDAFKREWNRRISNLLSIFFPSRSESDIGEVEGWNDRQRERLSIEQSMSDYDEDMDYQNNDADAPYQIQKTNKKYGRNNTPKRQMQYSDQSQRFNTEGGDRSQFIHHGNIEDQFSDPLKVNTQQLYDIDPRIIEQFFFIPCETLLLILDENNLRAIMSDEEIQAITLNQWIDMLNTVPGYRKSIYAKIQINEPVKSFIQTSQRIFEKEIPYDQDSNTKEFKKFLEKKIYIHMPLYAKSAKVLNSIIMKEKSKRMNQEIRGLLFFIFIWKELMNIYALEISREMLYVENIDKNSKQDAIEDCIRKQKYINHLLGVNINKALIDERSKGSTLERQMAVMKIVADSLNILIQRYGNDIKANKIAKMCMLMQNCYKNWITGNGWCRFTRTS